MLQLTGKTEKEIVNLFNKESFRVNALNYNKFLNSKQFKNNSSIMDLLYFLQTRIKFNKFNYINKRLTTTLNSNLVLDFYNELGLKDKVEAIISGIHPLYITTIDKDLPSQVAHSGTNPKLSFMVGQTGTMYGVINLAHELAHAINGHYLEMQNFIKEQNETIENFGKESNHFKEFNKKFRNFLNESSEFSKDCCGEIESMIIELLLLEYLERKNTISPEDKNTYLIERNNSFKNNSILMFQEDFIYDTILKIKNDNGSTCENLSIKEFKELQSRLKSKNHFDAIIKRFYFIATRTENNKRNWHSSYRFRYIVGEIVSTVWMDKYSKSNKQEKEKMLSSFKDFLFNSNKHNMFSASKTLFNGTDITTIVSNYIKIQETCLQTIQY